MKELFKSLADFQQEVPVIHKGSKGYGYNYADLPAVFETINPLLKKHSLGFTQLIQGDYINTKIFSTKTGDCIESNIDIPTDVVLKGMNPYQVMGSAITYLRRYALSAALGLVTDVDNDANDAPPKPTAKPLAQKSGIPKSTTRKPQSKATPVVSKPAAKVISKATQSNDKKVKINSREDEAFKRAKMSVIEGIRTVDFILENSVFSNAELKKEFLRQVGQNHE